MNKLKEEIMYCDNDCGEVLKTSNQKFYIDKLPKNIVTANKGESACLCKSCFNKIMKG